MMNKPCYIIFYDTQCGLCHWCIRLVWKYRGKSVLYFAPLGGNTFKQKLNLKEHEIQDSIYFYHSQTYFIKSNAVLEIARQCQFPLKFILLAKIIPRFIRDAIYDVVAKKRKAQFGPCLYIPEMSQYMLD